MTLPRQHCLYRRAVRRRPLDHHLWAQRGIWWINYAASPTPITKARIRHSLDTRDVEVARRKRDAIFAALA